MIDFIAYLMNSNGERKALKTQAISGIHQREMCIYTCHLFAMGYIICHLIVVFVQTLFAVLYLFASTFRKCASLMRRATFSRVIFNPTQSTILKTAPWNIQKNFG